MSKYNFVDRVIGLPRSNEDAENDADEEFLLKEESGPQTPAKKSFFQRHFTAINVHSSLILFYLIIGATILAQRKDNSCTPHYVATPLEDAISYKTDYLTDNIQIPNTNGTNTVGRDQPEFGPPSPEIEESWSDMLQYSNIRLHRDELNEDFRDIQTLAELSDGSGIYSSVSVFHSIHCLKRLRFLLYPEHYYPNATEEKMFELQAHAEHCLSYLLHSAKCNADLTVFPMQWGKKAPIPFGIDQGHHQCKDWNRIQDWARERSIDIYKPGLLMHPTYGWAYATGVDWVTGVSVGDSLLADEHEGHEH